MSRNFRLALLLVVITSRVAFATQPLITDDTETQGTGRFQLELEFENARDELGGISNMRDSLHVALTYGLLDAVDLAVSVPYQYLVSTSFLSKSRVDGFSDTVLEVKWRFAQMGGLSFAIKPGISLPSGDESRGLGEGAVGCHFFFIATEAYEPWKFHLNFGYIRNENAVDQRSDIWHLSLASEFQMFTWLKAVANIGAERSPQKGSDNPIGFVLGGLVFPVIDRMDLDIGIKGGLTKPASNYSLLAGVTIRF